jgi:hypothetical protein
MVMRYLNSSICTLLVRLERRAPQGGFLTGSSDRFRDEQKVDVRAAMHPPVAEVAKKDEVCFDTS